MHCVKITTLEFGWLNYNLNQDASSRSSPLDSWATIKGLDTSAPMLQDD